jgi:hypothetical protein
MEAGIMLDNPMKIEGFRLLALRSAMKMEVRYGLKATSRSKGNPFKIAKLEYGIKGRTKEEIFNNFNAFLEQTLGM